MKKQLSLLLAAAMVVTMLPMSAFAKSTNSISKVQTVALNGQIKTQLDVEIDTAMFPGTSEYEEFQLKLTGAEWNTNKQDATLPGISNNTSGAYNGVEVTDGTATISNAGKISYKVIDAKTIVVKVEKAAFDLGNADAPKKIEALSFPVIAKATDKGVAEITLSAIDSVFSEGTYPIANVASGSVTASIEKKTDVPDKAEGIKNIVLTETAAGSLESGKTVTIKIGGEFEFNTKSTVTLEMVAGSVATGDTEMSIKTGSLKVTDDEITFETDGDVSTRAAMYLLKGIEIRNTSDAEVGDIAELTISGAGIDKVTLEVGTMVDYGYTWKVEDKDLPEIIAGQLDEDNETLKITLKEIVEGSWLFTRKTTIEFPEEVKIIGVDVTDSDKVGLSEDNIAGVIEKGINKNKTEFTFSEDSSDTEEFLDPSGKVKLEMTFSVSVEPGFEGDIVAKIYGGGESEEQSVTAAKAVMPVKVESKKNEVKIDYRNVAINDITITETVPGALDKDIDLFLNAEGMQFEDTVEYEVTAGDLKLDDVSVTGGTLDIDVKSVSSKEAGVIKLSNLQLYLNRSLPTGDYKLDILEKSFENTIEYAKASSAKFTDSKNAEVSVADNATEAKKIAGYFSDCDVTVMKDFVTVVTAGRDQDDSTFTTKIVVTIGATEMKAGDTVIDLSVDGAPAYINKDGYTMMPLRAVTKALSGQAIVSWDDATKTVTVLFGSRVISMTIGSNIMTISGTQVPMSAAPEITDARTFLPLRDLGHALGLNDDKIAWDDATKTATLN